MLFSVDKDAVMCVEPASGGVAIKLPICKDLVFDGGEDLLAEYQKGRKIEILGCVTTSYRLFRKRGFPYFGFGACSEYRNGTVLVDRHPIYRFSGNHLEAIQ